VLLEERNCKAEELNSSFFVEKPVFYFLFLLLADRLQEAHFLHTVAESHYNINSKCERMEVLLLIHIINMM